MTDTEVKTVTGGHIANIICTNNWKRKFEKTDLSYIVLSSRHYIAYPKKTKILQPC